MIQQMETFHGWVQTIDDAIILLEACLTGVLPMLSRRLSINEKKCIRSGSVFVFDENRANIRRWTDNHLWSASRQEGNIPFNEYSFQWIKYSLISSLF